MKNPGSGGRSNDRMIAHVVALPLTATNDPSRSPQSAEVTAQVHAVLRAQNWDGQDTAPTLTGRLYGGLGAQTMPDKGNMGAVLQPVVMAHGQANAEVRTDGATPTLVCVHEAPIVALPPVVPYDLFQITAPINRQSRDERSPCHTLAKDNEAHAAVVMAAVAFHPTQDPISSTDGSTHAMGCGSSGGYATVAVAQPMAFNAYQRTEADVTWPLMAGDAKKVEVGVRTGMAVRRLTPEECERLQGFPDNHTRIPWKGKPASDCPDGPRYRALGNSMAVPVIAWIGRKIEERIAAAVATR